MASAAKSNYNCIHLEKPMTQKALEKLAASKKGMNTTSIVISPEYDDSNPAVIDLNGVSFPNLEMLSITAQAVKAINMSASNYPKLQLFSLEQPCATKIEYLDFHLPQLISMSLRIVKIADSTGFGKSISRSPNLVWFRGYKLLGLAYCQHTLVLPNCLDLDLLRSDDLCSLKIWAPKIETLNLQACFSLDEVDILNEKPPGYGSKAYHFEGEPSRYKVNIVNSGGLPEGNLLTHNRCLDVKSEMDYECF